MLKIIGGFLYGLAVTAGVAGLFVGGIPLVQFALERMHDYEYRGYYDTTYLHAPEIIFLLSLMLLVFVHIGLVIEKRTRPANPPKPVSAGEQVKGSLATANIISGLVATVVIDAQAERETADEKLVRLLNQKKD